MKPLPKELVYVLILPTDQKLFSPYLMTKTPHLAHLLLKTVSNTHTPGQYI